MAFKKTLGKLGSQGNLKKLDRILVREDVMKQFVKASRFANYVADKKDFSNEVRKGWKDEVQAPFDKDLKEKAARLLHECNIATEDELRAKIKWLREGDKNTSFFHGTLKAREHKNRVETVCAEVGIRYVGDEVSGKFVDHFQRFIAIVEDVTNLEIKNVMFDINNSKASGHDRYTSYKESLKVVKKPLDDFSKVSGLFPNMNKSTIFFCSITEIRKHELLEVMPFKCGNFPMKYLGVPLLVKRIRVNECGRAGSICSKAGSIVLLEPSMPVLQ
ncbi:hypothetical protein Tco_0860232 [Tanacetum coccineum]|uniref:Uncharacterized protein n=1 Tax=Tanacetum coccineum TaxID=301880 RepID=A0ABQ5BEC9_9ASTR